MQYLLGLGHAISAATQVLRVKGQPERLAAPRLVRSAALDMSGEPLSQHGAGGRVSVQQLLFASARITLGNGLRLLGLTPVQRM